MLSEYAFKIGRKKGNDFFDHSTTLIEQVNQPRSQGLSSSYPGDEVASQW